MTLICIALLHLHELGLIHRDLKPENMFIFENGFFKVGDFGLCKQFDPNRKTLMTTRFGGSILYMAPEQFMPNKVSKKPKINEKIDVWAVGVITFELCTGKLPFEGNS